MCSSSNRKSAGAAGLCGCKSSVFVLAALGKVLVRLVCVFEKAWCV